MKHIFILLALFIFTSVIVFSQSSLEFKESKTCVTVGLLQGGGALIGGDIEFLLSDRFGVQVGAGIVGFGAGLNYHLSPSIRSSFISLTYWNQGLGNSFAQNAVGPTFVYRSKKWFTCQIGLGVPLSEGPAFPNNIEQQPVMLLYSIGGYFLVK